MCTTTRFLGWAPGSIVPSQSPMAVRASAAATAGEDANGRPRIRVNPAPSMNDDRRHILTVSPDSNRRIQNGLQYKPILLSEASGTAGSEPFNPAWCPRFAPVTRTLIWALPHHGGGYFIKIILRGGRGVS